jgi:hypothetical protein
VTDLRRELIGKEDAGWADFRSLIDPLTPEQLTTDGYYPDWSIKDLMAHLGAWMAECGQILQQRRMDTYRKWDRDVDRLNAEWHSIWREVELRVVRAQLMSARARMLEEWGRLPQEYVGGIAEEWFLESGPGHYEEHLPRLREWVEEVSA